jgi:preprotein translocase subunit SecD
MRVFAMLTAVLLCVLVPAPAAGASQQCFTPTNHREGEPSGMATASQEILIHLDLANLPDSARDPVRAETARVLGERLQHCGLQAPVVRFASGDVIAVDIPTSWIFADTAMLLGHQAQVEFREERGTMSDPDWDLVMGPGQDGTIVALTGDRFARVELTLQPGTNQPQILFELDEDGTRLLAEATGRLVGRRLGIFVDDEPVMTPVVQSTIANGRGQITGRFTLDEAQALSAQLTSGPLPVPVWIESPGEMSAPMDDAGD